MASSTGIPLEHSPSSAAPPPICSLCARYITQPQNLAQLPPTHGSAPIPPRHITAPDILPPIPLHPLMPPHTTTTSSQPGKSSTRNYLTNPNAQNLGACPASRKLGLYAMERTRSAEIWGIVPQAGAPRSSCTSGGSQGQVSEKVRPRNAASVRFGALWQDGCNRAGKWNVGRR